MKKTKRLLSALTAFTLLATLLVGCMAVPAANDGYRVLDEDLDKEEYGIGFRNEDIALGLEVQRILDEMIEDGAAAAISNKWFGTDIMVKDAEFKEEDAAPEGDGSLDAIIAKGTLVMGLDDSFPPMGFRDNQNNIVGFDVDLATEVAARLGVELVLQPIDWDAKELELSSGKIDCIWNGMTITDERIGSMYITKPYVNNRQIVIVANNSKINAVADMADKTVGLQKGSSALNALNKNAVSTKVKEISEYPDNVTAFMDLKAGRVDAFVVDEIVGRYLLEQDAENSATE